MKISASALGCSSFICSIEVISINELVPPLYLF